MLSRRSFIWLSSLSGAAAVSSCAPVGRSSDSSNADLPPALAALTSMRDQARPITADERLARAEKARTLMAAEGIDAYWPSYGPAYIARKLTLDIDGVKVVPLGGISRASILFCNRDGGYLTYQSDEHGFRNPTGLYDSDPLQVAIVGDSFAAGTDSGPASGRSRSVM